jgi:hypothetical protein
MFPRHTFVHKSDADQRHAFFFFFFFFNSSNNNNNNNLPFQVSSSPLRW